jgi:hypothetical protein
MPGSDTTKPEPAQEPVWFVMFYFIFFNQELNNLFHDRFLEDWVNTVFFQVTRKVEHKQKVPYFKKGRVSYWWQTQ